MSGGDGRVTTVGLTLGTPAYVSPEQITGEATVERRSLFLRLRRARLMRRRPAS
jgi:hypothetical protein